MEQSTLRRERFSLEQTIQVPNRPFEAGIKGEICEVQMNELYCIIYNKPLAINVAVAIGGGQTFPKSTEFRSSVEFHPFLTVRFRAFESVSLNQIPSSFCSSHNVMTSWKANSA